MAENRDEILANFQACTGIDDVGAALTHLEETGWDLGRAVNRAIPENMANRANDSSPDIEMIEEIPNPLRSSGTAGSGVLLYEPELMETVLCSDVHVPRNSHNQGRISQFLDMPSLPSTSRNNDGILHITIEHNDRKHKIEISSKATVMDLKKKIQAITCVQVCRQAISGWKRHPLSDYTALSALGLSSDSRLLVRDSSSDGYTGDEDRRLKLQYTLVITEESSGKITTLPYSGDKTVSDVKTDICLVTNIKVRHQEWTGWPTTLSSDSVKLGLAGLDHPQHNLTLRCKQVEEPKKPKRVLRIEDSDESSVEEFEDAAETFTGDDDLFLPESRIRKQPLIPEKVEDETMGCLHFADEFSSRYGPIHPEFFPGTLEESIKEACMKPAKERRLLALYLHHDGSVLSNVFCTQILCCDSVVQILAAYFVLWGWDLTFTSNEQKFINSFTSGLGSMAAMQIKGTVAQVDRLPCIVIISRVRSAIEIMSVLQGNVGVNELMASLTETVDVFLTQQKVETREEEERSAREMIMMQQDVAYRESLEKDRAKEMARMEQERLENQVKEMEQQLRAQEEAAKESERKTVESRLPPEPDVDSVGITKIRVRLPKGEFLERRFNVTDLLQTLLDWLHSVGYRSSEYKLLSSWPRRDLTAADVSQTLKQLSLYPQETVILEER